MTIRRIAVLAAAAAIGVLALPAGPAQAHPLGNFSVNTYTGLTLRTDRIDVLAAVDFAEIPTLQAKPQVEADGVAGYATAECTRLAGALTVDGLIWTVTEPTYQLTPGSAGLPTSRLGCRLSAPAQLTEPLTVRVQNAYRSGSIGWREMTAKGAGVRIEESTVPAESISDELRTYPRDPLTSPPDVREATIRTGGEGVTSSVATNQAAPTAPGPGWLAAAQRQVESALGGKLTPVVVTLAFLLAILLGAGHAALPGHGKTVMAAYFAGRRGRVRDALTVGGTVTLAHTGGVLLVGLLLSTSTALVGERLLAWLGVASGVLVVAVGVGMLVSALRSRRSPAHAHGHGHGSHHHHGLFGHHHGHTHDDHHTHDGPHHHSDSAHGHPHTHGHDGNSGGRPGGRLGLAGIGLAGGLVPSPSALVVLLGAIGLGRAGLGVLLVLAYGIGMAGTLTAVGLLLVVAQRRLGHLISRGGTTARVSGLLARLGGRISASAPTATAALVVLVGLGMGVRAVA
ncbi:hypothetical protein [Paractinoplanes rishiriensis]|uniref:High-affinity nickel-transporter n=1 Tax=Paractinoplanes rishiriensis TaxID=1050105 RepID=A0A919MQX7_9ACTN|nr:hypothetical protein [Actinoplanes rishiriensis]GIE96606.1 hypothetical protein Ari01nite_40710 [Actinoplanes rishiriensis]